MRAVSRRARGLVNNRVRKLVALRARDVEMHPEHRRELTLGEMVAMYAWHGEHHVAHITSLRKRMGWN